MPQPLPKLQTTTTQPVFDVDRLAEFMRLHIDGFTGSIVVEQLAGGQSNPTYLIRAGKGKAYVLRCKPLGKLLPSAHAIDREFRVISALAHSEVPVPET